MDANLLRRIAVAVVGIPLALAFVWYGSWPLAALVALLTVLGTRELYIMAELAGVKAFRATGGIAAGALPILAYASLTDNPLGDFWRGSWAEVSVIWLLTVMVLTLRFRSKDERPIEAAAVTVLAVLYATVLPMMLIDMRHSLWPAHSWAGAALVFFPFVVTWVCDTAAMFGGRAFKGPKLAPTISPGKTRSGAIAGVVAGMLVAPLFTTFVFPRVGIEVDLVPAIITAILLAVVGQVGDLVESLFKREAGVKDSSALIPGHGGVLDRLDSLYFVIPVAAICYRIIGLV
jgi:phosphatidate cytidylyltransferase